MKKIVCFVITLVFLAIVCTFCLSAADIKESSRKFSEPVYDMIEGAYKSNTIKIYHGWSFSQFAEKKSIDEIVTDESMLSPYYAVKGNFSFARYFNVHDGEVQLIMMNPPDLGVTLNYVTSPSLVLCKVSPFCVAQNVYCLDGGQDGVIIYYKTNQGDYVYYKEYAEAEEEYLFPVEEFYDFAGAYESKLQQEREEREHLDSIHKYTFGGPTLLSSVVDISSYKVTPMNFWFVALGVLVGVVAVAVPAVVIIRKKRTKTSS